MIARADAIRRMVMDAARLTGLDLLARPCLGGMGAILMMHRITAHPRRPSGPNRHLAVCPGFLDETIKAMKADGFVFVSMDEALQRLRAGYSGERFAAITADDGYRDNLREALPVLESHRAPITIYVAPALIDGTVPIWWEAIEDIVEQASEVELPGKGEVLECRTPQGKAAAFIRLRCFMTEEVEELAQSAVVQELARRAGTDPFAPGRETLMTWEEICELARHPLATIGAHTTHHFNLRRLPIHTALRELQESRQRLAEELGAEPRHFAYPYGYSQAVGPREAELAREAGYASAVTTRHGLVREKHIQHLHALPRIALNGRFQNIDHVQVMTRGWTTPLANRGRRLVTV